MSIKIDVKGTTFFGKTEYNDYEQLWRKHKRKLELTIGLPLQLPSPSTFFHWTTSWIYRTSWWSYLTKITKIHKNIYIILSFTLSSNKGGNGFMACRIEGDCSDKRIIRSQQLELIKQTSILTIPSLLQMGWTVYDPGNPVETIIAGSSLGGHVYYPNS